uniref:Uncharacterized protein n=1 Tax=Rhizophora mucronata TaxID=61149 RepID=A0A2P2N821_RHIMU
MSRSCKKQVPKHFIGNFKCTVTKIDTLFLQYAFLGSIPAKNILFGCSGSFASQVQCHILPSTSASQFMSLDLKEIVAFDHFPIILPCSIYHCGMH